MSFAHRPLLLLLLLSGPIAGALLGRGLMAAGLPMLAGALWAAWRIHRFLSTACGTPSSDAATDEALGAEPDRGAERHAEDVIETMAGALILADPERRIVRVNHAACQLTGYGPEALLGRPLAEIFPEESPVNTGSLIQLSASGRMRNVERVFRHRDGSDLPILFSGSALRDDEGELLQFVCVAYDIRPLKKLEERLRASLDEKELLLREVHHRVKNNLQVISSLLDLQADQLESQRDRELIRDSRHRIRSMALIHEQLYRHNDLSHVTLGPYLENIAAHLFRSYGVEPGRLMLRCRLEPIAIDLDRAVACGLIVNELISNCLEHAFDTASHGEIHLELSRARTEAGEDQIQLEIRDDGRGFDISADRSQSMGLELVSMMVEQLGGRLNIHSGHLEETSAEAEKAEKAEKTERARGGQRPDEAAHAEAGGAHFRVVFPQLSSYGQEEPIH